MSHAHIKALTEVLKKALTAPKQPDYERVNRRSGHTVNGVQFGGPCRQLGESWGRMYWGDNPTSAPAAPTIDSVVADSDTITITMAPYPQGDGTDGWSAVYEYQVVCGNLDPVTFTDSVTIQNLDSDTEYSCAVTATNEIGDSDQTLQVVMTDAALRGLNIILLCAAIECGSS